MSKNRSLSALWEIVKETWVFITFVIIAIVMIVMIATSKDKEGRGLFEQVAYEVGELVGEASKGFDEAKKK